jgi:hypothetical protein
MFKIIVLCGFYDLLLFSAPAVLPEQRTGFDPRLGLSVARGNS